MGAGTRRSLEEAPERFRERIEEMEKMLGAPLPEWGKDALPGLAPLETPASELRLRYRYAGRSAGEPGFFEIRFALKPAPAPETHWIVEAFEPAFVKEDAPAEIPKERAASEGLRRLSSAFALPDLAGFPAATSLVRLKSWILEGGRTFELRADFEAGANGGLFLEGFSVKARERVKGGAVAADPAPARGPFASIRGLLEAMDGDAFEKVWAYVPKTLRARANREASEKRMREEWKREVERRGFSPAEVVPPGLPTLLSLPPRTARLEIEYAFPGTAGGSKGVFRFEFGLLTDRKDAPNWIVETLEVGFDRE
jgi:hypothetical protein